jgi:hypothetical protein
LSGFAGLRQRAIDATIEGKVNVSSFRAETRTRGGFAPTYKEQF